MAEEIILQDDNVSVTTARIVIHGKTYALRNVTSVRMGKIPVKNGCAGLLLLGGVVLLLVGASTAQQDGPGVLILGLVVAVVAAFWLSQLKTLYSVTIASAAGEAHALKSANQTYIASVVEAINEAVVRYR